MRRDIHGACIALTFVMAPAGPAVADTELSELRGMIERMKQDYERRIQALEARLKQAELAAQKAEAAAREAEVAQRVSAVPPAPPATPEAALDEAVAEIQPPEQAATVSRDLWSERMGGTNVRLLDIALVGDVAAGGSSATSESIELLQGGEHDPRRNGFTFQQAELSLKGAVDPYFTGEAHFLFSEEGAEAEEAFFTTTSLPYDFQLEGGLMLTEFGRNNPRHLHQWLWIDQPFINTRLFSGEGNRSAGFRLGKLLPTSWYSELHFGAQDPTNETAVSFLGEAPGHGHAHGGEEEEEGSEEGLGGFARTKTSVSGVDDLLYLVRLVNGGELTPEWSTELGLSVLTGPNTTDDRTWIYGADLVAKWRPSNHFRGWPFFTWQTEIMKRDYNVDTSNVNFEPGVTSDKLEDWGLYSEALYGFKYRWAGGLRMEYASGSGNGEGPRKEDPFRSDRLRISPMLAWHPSEFSRVRLQYNYDDADFLKAREGQKDAHSLWLSFEYTFGAHPPHKY